MSSKSSGGIRETVKTVFWAIVIAVVVRTVAFEPFNIPSGSMRPTLLVGDYLFVSKYSYGYSRYSLPLNLPLIPGRIFMKLPKRGDIVVFKLPNNTSVDYIKRVIGLPGDRIQMRRGRLWINEKMVERRRIEDFVFTNEYGIIERLAQFVETLPNGVRHRILERSDHGELDDTQVYTVPKGHFFAMGDNRDNSQDSRVINAVGYVPIVNLVGRAEILFFSHNSSATWWEFWRWPGAIRFNRFFTVLE